MHHLMRAAVIPVAAGTLSLATLACSGREQSATGSAKAEASTSASVPKVQTGRAPCDWITRAEVEKVFGEPLTGDPVRVRSAENPIPQPDGDGCLYELKSTSQLTKRTVAIQIDLDDAGGMQAGFSGVPDIKATFKDKESKGDSMVDGRWDYVSGVPGGLTMAREGRITAMISAWGEAEKGMALASAIVDKIPDLPFANNAADPLAKSTGRDPCSLIPQKDVEAVIGALTQPPYRSRESSSLAHGNGASCSYFTGKHRVLVVTPTFDGGAMQYRMMAGVGGMVSGVLGGGAAKPAAAPVGKWEQITTSATGALVFLKGDQMVELQFKSSPADYNGAVKLAQVAAERL